MKSLTKSRPPSIPACPPPRARVHSWQLAAANRCRLAGLSEQEAVQFITERMTRAPKPANEVVVAVAKAFANLNSFHYHGHVCASRFVAPRPLIEIDFDPAKLATVAARVTQPHNWRHWLWERSPKRPETQNAFSFLSNLYASGEQVQIVDRFEQKHWQTIRITLPLDCRIPASISNGGRYGEGVWFLCNPVDGEWHDTGDVDRAGKPIFSCRNWQAVTSFRYAVLESDQAAADQWLAFIVQLPVRIAAIYTSGSRYIHCLIRLDARSKDEWDKIIAPLKRPMKVLGADPACLSAVRLTRLPGCSRPNKKGFQRLLFLCPNPTADRLLDLPIIQSRFEALDRWRNLCPRWNQNQEAFR